MKKPEKLRSLVTDGIRYPGDIRVEYYKANEMDAYIAHLETQVERLSFAVREAMKFIVCSKSVEAGEWLEQYGQKQGGNR
jgi:hypothetical protein